ncbi:helix-turn-helix domain-containing protein [Streptococcus parasuis]|uniref:helix-turn-helix domain-containing protein n=1 Tax=Streptococcus parasuis TaxID=1501662 RepID=UPI00370DC490
MKDLREDYDFKQEYLAQYLSCSQSAYSNIEAGKRQLSIDYLIKLSNLVLCQDLVHIKMRILSFF